MTRLWRRLREVVIHRILGVEDTPHRIAWGVFLGFLVGWSPTIGFQILIYIAIASVAGANKLSGVPILFISNPFTAVPLYYFAWSIGVAVLHGAQDPGLTESAVRERLASISAQREGWAQEFMTREFWSDLGAASLELGGELWLGGLVMGTLCGVPGYLITLWAVRTYRRSKDALPSP